MVFNEQEAEDYLKTKPVIEYETETNDEKKERMKKDRKVDINNKVPELYALVDTTLNNRVSLVNSTTVLIKDYKEFKQTEFGIKLIELLKIITNNCVNYIDKKLSNLSIDPFELLPQADTVYVNYIWVSSLNCNSFYSIHKLYNYLKDVKFTKPKLMRITQDELEAAKTELKKTLKSYLITICQDPEFKEVIKGINIPENIPIPPPQPNQYIDIPGDIDSIYMGKGGGGNNKITRTSKKEILGKERCIYKKSGDRKEYVKYKKNLITVKDFKKLMKSKQTKRK